MLVSTPVEMVMMMCVGDAEELLLLVQSLMSGHTRRSWQWINRQGDDARKLPVKVEW